MFEPGRASFTEPGESTPDATFFGAIGARLGVTGPGGDALRLYDGSRLEQAEGTETTPGLEHEPDLFRFELANPTAPAFVPSPLPGVDLANDADPSLRDSFVLEGSVEEERLAGAVSLGDFNGDSFNDLLVYGEKGSYVLLGPVELDSVTSIEEAADIIVSRGRRPCRGAHGRRHRRRTR